MTTLIEQAVEQLKDVVSRENDDTLTIMRQQITERTQHVDFVEQWFIYMEQKIETDRRAAQEQVFQIVNERFADLTAEFDKLKDAILPGTIKAVTDMTEAMNRFKKTVKKK